MLLFAFWRFKENECLMSITAKPNKYFKLGQNRIINGVKPHLGQIPTYNFLVKFRFQVLGQIPTSNIFLGQIPASQVKVPLRMSSMLTFRTC